MFTDKRPTHVVVRPFFAGKRAFFASYEMGKIGRYFGPMNPLNRVPAIPAIPRQGGVANVPGLRRLWLIEARHVLAVDDPRQSPGFINTSWLLTPEGLQLSEDAVLNALSFPSDRGAYEQKALVTVQGVSYGQSLTVVVPRDHIQTTLAVQRMMGRGWILIYEDGNGLRKLVGTKKQPLRFDANLKSTPNAWVFSWTGETRQPAPLFNDNDLFAASDLNLTTEFSYGFSYDFFS